MNGVFLIDKEKGCTSRDVVNEIIKHVETNKVGHTGTLDPIATGVLVVCVGKATKLVNTLTCENKEYEAQITLGIDTDTLDITGTILKTEIPIVSENTIEEVVKSFKGEYYQEVPIYSAVKVNGKKLYEYARNNEKVTLPKRLVQIDNIELLGPIKYKDNNIIFNIRCSVSKGTYIRALVKDIATKLHTIGVMSELRRTKLGNIDIHDCVKIDDLRITNMVPVSKMLKEYNCIVVDGTLKKDILNGKIIDNIYNSDKVVFIDNNDLVLAIYKKYEKDDTKMKPDMVLGGI